MAFEGVEKKVEVLLKPGSPSLRSKGHDYWKNIVAISKAEVLSTISNNHVDAYLLSESSLFVFDDRMIMITCGQTRLIDGVTKLLGDFDKQHLESLIYERKNELYPGKQPTTFSEDVDLLSRMVDGESHVFGDPETHHLSLFHLNHTFEPPPQDTTTELLMYDLTPETAIRFAPGNANPLGDLGLAKLFPDYQWDDHLFSPAGYSLNGIHQQYYMTVHITPDVPGSYASLETNAPLDTDTIGQVAQTVLPVLQPRRFDLIQFQDTHTPLASLPKELGTLHDDDTRQLNCGYTLHFFHYRN